MAATGGGGGGGGGGSGGGASASPAMGFTPTTVAQGLSMGFMGPTGISAASTNSGLGFVVGPVSNANSVAQSSNSGFGFNPSNIASVLGEPTGDVAGSAMSSVMGETSVPPWVLPQTDIPADVVMNKALDVPVEFQFEGMQDKGQVTHQNLSNIPAPTDSVLLAEREKEIQRTQESFEKVDALLNKVPFSETLSETIPSEAKTVLGLTLSPLVPGLSVPYGFLGEGLSAQLGESGASNIGATIGFLGSPAGIASMSPGNPAGQASGFAAKNLDDPSYARGLTDRPDAEMSYQGERPAEEEPVTLESLIAEITQGSPIGLTTPEGAASGTSSIDTSPLIELIVQVALGNIARQRQDLPQQSQRTYPSSIQQILDEFYNETTA